jgi:hypothetical protein
LLNFLCFGELFLLFYFLQFIQTLFFSKHRSLDFRISALSLSISLPVHLSSYIESQQAV